MRRNMNHRVPDWAQAVAQSILLGVKAKDPFTYYHCCRVGLEARKLAKYLGLDTYQQTILEYSGMFHDIGKVSIANNILLKPAKLTDEEYKTMKSHSEISVQMIQPLADYDPFFKLLVPGIRYHHERFDGKGYPHKIAGKNIPLTARILSIIDTVDAMTNTRPYRKGLDMEIAKDELIKHSNTQFDKDLVLEYLRSVKEDIQVDEEKFVSQKFLQVA